LVKGFVSRIHVFGLPRLGKEFSLKRISCFEDLSPHGVIPLTGEACGLSYRILCDVTAKGKRLLEKVLGVQELSLAENWNHGSESEPHIGSVMLIPELLTALGVFALLEAGCKEVWTVGNSMGVFGFESNDDEQTLHCFKAVHDKDLGRRFGYFGTAGDRNVHVFTGRVQ
jgi:hypothetical protein